VGNLQFTRESEFQLADMAGNAMTCTVVGAVIIGALIVNKDILQKLTVFPYFISFIFLLFSSFCYFVIFFVSRPLTFCRFIFEFEC
jgi:hypothetical protein